MMHIYICHLPSALWKVVYHMFYRIQFNSRVSLSLYQGRTVSLLRHESHESLHVHPFRNKDKYRVCKLDQFTNQPKIGKQLKA